MTGYFLGEHVWYRYKVCSALFVFSMIKSNRSCAYQFISQSCWMVHTRSSYFIVCFKGISSFSFAFWCHSLWVLLWPLISLSFSSSKGLAWTWDMIVWVLYITSKFTVGTQFKRPKVGFDFLWWDVGLRFLNCNQVLHLEFCLV